MRYIRYGFFAVVGVALLLMPILIEGSGNASNALGKRRAMAAVPSG